MFRTLRILPIALAGLLAASATASADDDRIAELERKIDLLSQALERNELEEAFTPIGESVFGMGAAASKVYAARPGVSLGGYGEALYQDFQGGPSTSADFLRCVVYLGYKYDDKWLLNTEIEFEHASTAEEGSTSVEFAYLDYLRGPTLNFRVGLLLLPMGLINEGHEPIAFHGARRPDIENRIIPTTWRENGLGVFGDIGDVSYKAYVVNGLKAEDFSARGLRGGRQKGSKAVAEDLAIVIRADWSPSPGLTIGGSAYNGTSGQDLGVGVSTEIYEAHVDWRRHALSIRFLATLAKIDDVPELNRAIAAAEAAEGETTLDADIDSIGDELAGWYLELAYDLHGDKTPATLTPFARIESYNTQEKVPAGFQPVGGQNDINVVTVGIDYKPRTEIVFKADVQFYDSADGSAPDQFNLAMGYVF